MHPYQQRVVDELSELEERLDKLRTFIGIGEAPASSVFLSLDNNERVRLSIQAHYMCGYRDILRARVATFAA